jgi:hypothetical protein
MDSLTEAMGEGSAIPGQYATSSSQPVPSSVTREVAASNMSPNSTDARSAPSPLSMTTEYILIMEQGVHAFLSKFTPQRMASISVHAEGDGTLSKAAGKFCDGLQGLRARMAEYETIYESLVKDPNNPELRRQADEHLTQTYREMKALEQSEYGNMDFAYNRWYAYVWGGRLGPVKDAFAHCYVNGMQQTGQANGQSTFRSDLRLRTPDKLTPYYTEASGFKDVPLDKAVSASVEVSSRQQLDYLAMNLASRGVRVERGTDSLKLTLPTGESFSVSVKVASAEAGKSAKSVAGGRSTTSNRSQGSPDTDVDVTWSSTPVSETGSAKSNAPKSPKSDQAPESFESAVETTRYPGAPTVHSPPDGSTGAVFGPRSKGSQPSEVSGVRVKPVSPKPAAEAKKAASDPASPAPLLSAVSRVSAACLPPMSSI